MDSYDVTFSTPAPVLQKVKISNEYRKKESEELKGLIDSGAFMTVIPFEYVNRLELIPNGIQKVRGYDNKVSFENKYLVRISFKGFNFDKDVISTNRSTILIGRDVINELLVILDGKNLQFDIQDP